MLEIKIELKDYSQKPSSCPKCGSRYISIWSWNKNADPSILTDQATFKQKILGEDLNIDQRWDLIKGPLIRRFRCSREGSIFKIGPYSFVSLWSAPFITASYLSLHALNDAKVFFDSFIGTGWSIPTLDRRAHGINQPQPMYPATLATEIERQHLQSSKRPYIIAGGWLEDPNSKIGWWAKVDGEITSDNLTVLDQLVAISQQDQRMGTLSYRIS